MIPDVPDAPTGLLTEPITGGVNLNWTAPLVNGGSIVTGYKLDYVPVDSVTPENDTATIDSITDPSYTIPDLLPSTDYNVNIYALNALGESLPATASF